jgi:REP element-mobilizing transposase RayT
MTIYHDDSDRRYFLDRLADVCETHAVLCRSYCLMTNHYHLVVTTTRANVSDAMKQLNERYALHWNGRHDHVGHVFQGRFGGQLVQVDGYLAAVCRYVVLNPVRSRLVSRPEDWPWSSYAATIGLAPQPPFLNVDALLGIFGGDDMAAGALQFREFVCAAIGDNQRLPRTVILGDASFRERFKEAAAAASREVPRQQRQFRPDLNALFAGAVTRSARVAGMAEAYSGGYSMKEIGQYLGVHHATVSKALRSTWVCEGSGVEKSATARPDPGSASDPGSACPPLVPPTGVPGT